MKKIMITLFIILVNVSVVWSFDVKQSLLFNDVSSTDNFQMKNSYGYEIKLIKDNGWFLFGSYDVANMRIVGLPGPELEIFGAGVGLNYELNNFISVFGNVGVYYPQSSVGKISSGEHSGNWEAICWFMNKMYSGFNKQNWYWFEDYEYEIKPNIGFELGVSVEKQLSKSWYFDLVGTYRVLSMKETISVFGDRNSDRPLWWEYDAHRDLSGYRIGFGLTYKF